MNDHPQDVVVPSLPEPYDYVYGWSSGHRSLSHSYWNGVRPDTSDPVFTADQMNTRWLEGYEAGRAAGRASAEPEGRTLTDDELVDLDRCSTSNMPPWGIGSTRGHYLQAVRAALAAAPTPTASIAPKAEGEAVNLAGDFVEHSHPQFGGGYFCTPDVFARIEAHAAPVAQAAAGASEPIRKLLAEVLLFFHDCSESIRCIDRVVDLEERIGDALAPRPEADADRASGGGEGEGVKS